MEGVMVHRFRYAPAPLEDLTHDQTAPDRVRERPAYLALVPGFVASASLAARRISRRGDFDAIHVHWPLPMALPGLAARRAAGVPLICSFYGVELTFARSAPVPFLVPFLRHAIRSADAVTAISTYTSGLVRELHDRPVDLIPFGATTPVPDRIPALPPFPPLRLLFVGRLVERKGLHYLLDAMAQVPFSQVPLRQTSPFHIPFLKVPSTQILPLKVPPLKIPPDQYLFRYVPFIQTGSWNLDPFSFASTIDSYNSLKLFIISISFVFIFINVSVIKPV